MSQNTSSENMKPKNFFMSNRLALATSFLLLFITSSLHSQQITPSVWMSSGNVGTMSNGNQFSWTMGESFTTTLPSSTLTLTQGFQQLFNVLGCTDPTAFNYNANANQDDGSCIPLLTCNITAPTTNLCAGESVTLSMNTTGGGTGLNALPANLQQGLVAYYPFNGNANDVSGNGNNGTVNGATLTADRFGNQNNSYLFDGIDDFIEVTNSSSLQFSNSYSLSCWIRINNLSFNAPIDQHAIISKIVDGDWYEGYELRLLGGNTISQSGNIGGQNVDVGFSDVQMSQWYFVTMTFNGQNLKAYRNGELVSSFDVIGSIQSGNGPLRMGRRGGAGYYNNWFSGLIDDATLFNRALSPTEIQQLYTAQSYNWSNGGTATTTAVSPTTNTTYSCTVTQGAQTCTASVDVTVNPVVSNTVNATIIQGQSYTLGTQNFTTAGTYTEVFNSAAGCDSTVTLNLSIEPLLTCNITSTTESICEGESITLSINSGGNTVSNQLNTHSLAFTSGNYIRIPHSPEFNGMQEFTLECWYYQTGFDGGDEKIVGTEFFADGYSIENQHGDWSTRLCGANNCSALDYWNPSDNTPSINEGIWNHFAISYDGLTARHFLNGMILKEEYLNYSSIQSFQRDIVINRHTWNSGSSSRLSGMIDELRLSSSCRYTANFNLQQSQFISDSTTIGLWHFNEGSGGTILDESGNNHNGYVQGSVTWSDNIPFSTTPSNTILWSNGSTTSSNTVTPTSDSTYTCTVTQGAQTCTASVDIVVNPILYLYADFDGDGFGNPFAPYQECFVPMDYVLDNTDCNDNNSTISPNSTEICNDIDDNCDAQIDNGIATFTLYPDNDGDGYGNGEMTQSCSLLIGYSTLNGDCDDYSASVSPTAPEFCNNIDENCNGILNDGLWIAAYIDNDSDGYGAIGNSVDGICELSPGYVDNNNDCNDNEPLAYTGAFDVCDNGIDEDCSGSDNTCIVLGCTDPNACNYNEVANTEDFSCTYPQMDYLNCQGACNNDTDGDGVCDEIELLGCTNVTATNFNPEATEDDGSCIFNIEGCTDIQACNFDPAANFDNGSCILPHPETCNGLDDDCDDLIDEGLTPIGLNVIPIVTSIYPVCSGNSIKSANLNNGINSEVIDGNGNDLWFSLNAQYNTLRAGLSAAMGDNDIRLYQLTTNGCLQHIETEHEVTAGNQTLISDQLTIDTTYYIAIHNLSGNINPSAKICFNHLTGSTCDHYYSNNTGVYTSVCNSFKAQFRSNATAYMFEVLSASQNGSNTNITPWSYTTPTANSVVSRLGAILPANQTGSPIQYVLRVPVVYSMFDAAGNVESIVANATNNCNLTLNNENAIALRLSDRCPATKSLSGTIAPDRTVCGALRYDWEFTQVLPVESTPQIINGGNYTPIFFLSNVPGIETGKTYSVRVRPVHSSGNVGNWGVPHCLRIGNSGMMMQEIIEQSQDVISLFTIYPNPATSGSFVIQTNWTDEKEENVQVSIQDITGKIVFNQNIVLNNNKSLIEFGYLADGIYMVTIGEERKRLQILKK